MADVRLMGSRSQLLHFDQQPMTDGTRNIVQSKSAECEKSTDQLFCGEQQDAGLKIPSARGEGQKS